MLQKFTTKFLSILFRLVIICYSLILLFTEDNVFHYSWYLLAIVPYSIIYYKTLFEDRLYSKLRLLNDYIFIVFFAYGKEMGLNILIFTLLPIINSPNHSGEKKSYLLYFFHLISLTIINDFSWSWSFLVSTLPLFFINGIYRIKNQYSNSLSNLNNNIEEFLETDLKINKTYKIYGGLIKSLNSVNTVFDKPDVKQIVCFSIIENKIYLENSSEFIWSYSIDEDVVNMYVALNPVEKYLENMPITINNKALNNNFFLYKESKGHKYLFIVITHKPLHKLTVLYLKKILSSVTNRIARVIGAENEIKLEKKNMLKDFREKYFQIQNAEKAMHFIRNRFNTLDNFIEMSKDNISGKMDAEDLQIYATELDRLERNYKILMDRATSILNKSDKPFSAINLESKSINFVFNLIRETWLDYFDYFPAVININFELTEKQSTKVNFDGLYILISDWISNVNKYSAGFNNIEFSDDDESFIITFRNTYLIDYKDQIEVLKNDFNSTGRDKILQRTSHGVLIMKSILEEMGVKGKIIVNDNELNLVLTLKKE